MLVRLASFALVSLVLLPSCESCDFTFGPRNPEVAVVVADKGGVALDEAEADAIVGAATLEVCREDHDGRECDEHVLRDALLGGFTAGRKLDLESIYDGESYAHLTRCYFPGLELTITAPNCTAEPLSLSRTRSDQTSTPDEPLVITIRCGA